MAFKKLSDYNEARFGKFFQLANDGDSADVTFLYRNQDEVLVNDVHYIKSDDYSGYVSCLGKRNGCPGCQKEIRVQTKVFIPLYNFTTKQIEVWDRTVKFTSQLTADVFRNYPNPSEFIFRITRHGQAGDINTRYSIDVVQHAKVTLDQLIEQQGLRQDLMDVYGEVCKDVDSVEMARLLFSPSTSSSTPREQSTYDYTPVPRPSVDLPNAAPSAVAPPDIDDLEEVDDDDVNF